MKKSVSTLIRRLLANQRHKLGQLFGPWLRVAGEGGLELGNVLLVDQAKVEVLLEVVAHHTQYRWYPALCRVVYKE